MRDQNPPHNQKKYSSSNPAYSGFWVKPRKCYYKVVKIKDKTARQAIKFALLLIIGICLTLVFGIWWFEPQHISHNFMGRFHFFDYLLFFILTFVVWHQILMELLAWYAAAYITHPSHPTFPESDLRM
jgi:predicted membrane protein